MTRIDFVVPLKTINPLNGREHHMVRAKRVAKERKTTYLCFPRVTMPALIDVLLVRISPGTLDTDAVPAALKGVRDAVAYKLGVDDRTQLVSWSYAQEVGPAAVRVEVEIRGQQ